ncbi:hypothetical protein AURDEDRAFT_166573 [Auricularia subglabra TFB-10046 SS5]|nr:hypothetical protein AURDEDRAFT_166573 [Auricularia subglabra TFB-10046 SS5]
MSSTCVVQADPDIAGERITNHLEEMTLMNAGLGVRIAIYVQALVCMLPSVLLVLFGPDPETRYARVLVKMYHHGRSTVTTLLVTNGALLIVAFIKLAMGVLTHYHGAIVLNLSWIVFLSALSSAITVSFSHPQRGDSSLNMLWLPFLVLVTPATRDSSAETGPRFRDDFEHCAEIIRLPDIISQERHLILLSLHLSGMGLLGVLLFGVNGLSRNSCNADTVLWTFDHFVLISKPAFQRLWVAVYVLAAIPLVNVVCAVIVVFSFALPWRATLFAAQCLSARCNDQFCLPTALSQLGLALPFLTMILLLIASTEKTISGNVVSAGENAWGFGQILAIILLLPPVYDAYGRVRNVTVHYPRISFPVDAAWVADDAPDAERRRGAAHDILLNCYNRLLIQLVKGKWVPMDPEARNPTEFHRPFSENASVELPIIKSVTTIHNATTDEVFGVICPNGMRSVWDLDLDYDGVLRRYDQNTTQCYAAMKGELSAESGSGLSQPYDLCTIRQVERLRAKETIVMIEASMDSSVDAAAARSSVAGAVSFPRANIKHPDSLPSQAGCARARLSCAEWEIAPDGDDVTLTYTAHVVPAREMPFGAARDMANRRLAYGPAIRHALAQYGPAPLWGVPADTRKPAVILESEHADARNGTYTATFRALAAGKATLAYDTQQRGILTGPVRYSIRVIKGSRRALAHSDDGNGTITLTVGRAGVVCYLRLSRSLRSAPRSRDHHSALLERLSSI